MYQAANMSSKNPSFSFLIFLLFLLINLHPPSSFSATAAVPTPQSSVLFREYIGAESLGVKLSDVPINPNVEFHFILSFAIDYTPDGNSSTNGLFNVFWDSQNLSAPQVNLIKQNNCNVKVALSLGGDTANGKFAYFNPKSIDSWVSNAVSSLTKIIKEYDLDGIDIDYEHFSVDSDTFAECIGRLLKTLKCNNVISFASIAPYDYHDVQCHYIALWKKYGEWIDYVNFQFYAYPSNTTVSQFLNYYEIQSANYEGGKVLVSFAIDTSSSGGLSPEKGFFTACQCLKMEGKLHGIFVWSADDSVKYRFRYEKFSQNLLVGYF